MKKICHVKLLLQRHFFYSVYLFGGKTCGFHHYKCHPTLMLWAKESKKKKKKNNLYPNNIKLLDIYYECLSVCLYVLSKITS